ncbi:MAG: flavodoxin [Lachnospiraceae bacterium]|nr:flavodoxin [Lachnospiraceae bacterium]
MKTIVIYNSQTGFTKRYAKWIAEAAGADCVALPEAKKLIVFCVGASPITSDVKKSLACNFNEPKLERADVFYCPGGLNYEKMSAPTKLMMKMFVKMIKAKKDKSAIEVEMAKVMSSSYDIADKKYTEPILGCLLD